MFHDLLPWWKANGHRFPISCQRRATIAFAIPATSVQSERLFLLAGQIATKCRSSLGSDNVELHFFLGTVWPVLDKTETDTVPTKGRGRKRSRKKRGDSLGRIKLWQGEGGDLPAFRCSGVQFAFR